MGMFFGKSVSLKCSTMNTCQQEGLAGKRISVMGARWVCHDPAECSLKNHCVHGPRWGAWNVPESKHVTENTRRTNPPRASQQMHRERNQSGRSDRTVAGETREGRASPWVSGLTDVLLRLTSQMCAVCNDLLNFQQDKI